MSAISENEYRYNATMKLFPAAAEPVFESPEQQNALWGRQWGCDNDVGRLRMVLMHRPGDELSIVDPDKRIPEINSYGDVEAGWFWRGDTLPPLEVLQAEHDGLAELLRSEGVEVVMLDSVGKDRMKSCYTRDSLIAVKGGAIVPRLGPAIRRGEEVHSYATVARLGMPVLRTIHGAGLMEGGSFMWLDPKTAVVSRSTRGNEEGARQIEEVLNAQGVELIRVDVTGYRLHIDGMIVMLDVDKAIINPSQLPFWFLKLLDDRGIRTVSVKPEDPVSTVNCLAIAPSRVVMSKGVGERTREELDKLGVTVLETDYGNMYLGGGGIHCSTAPLIRDSV